MKINFKRTTERSWRGNGMGYDPAGYTIICDGVAVGTIWGSSIHGGITWRAELNGERLRGDFTLARTKQAVRDHIAAMQRQ
jgi:hypothetical protein